MDKKLKNHSIFIKNEIKKFEIQLAQSRKSRSKELVIKKASKLNKYNNEMIKNFQHERLIHLIVTFFFAGLLMLAIFTFYNIFSNLNVANYNILCALSSVIVVILGLTELFYIKHYYILENNTQKLYDLSEKLYKIIENDPKVDNPKQTD